MFYVFANNVPGSQKIGPQRIFAVIKNAVVSGEISAERINLSYQRIMALKKKIDLTSQVDLESNFKN